MLKTALAFLFVPLCVFAKADIDQSQDQIQLSDTQIKAMVALKQQGIELNEEAVRQMAKAEKEALESTQAVSLMGAPEKAVYLYCVHLHGGGGMAAQGLICAGNWQIIPISVYGVGVTFGFNAGVSVLKFTLASGRESLEGTYGGFRLGMTVGGGGQYLTGTTENGSNVVMYGVQIGLSVNLAVTRLRVGTGNR